MMKGISAFMTQRKRIGAIVLHTAYTFIFPFMTFVLSLITIRATSTAVWGAFAERLIVVHLLLLLGKWGFRTYLLREFSLHPSEISKKWAETTSGRLGVLLVCCLIVLFFPGWPLHEKVWLLIWVIAGYAYQAFDPFVVYFKRFLKPLVTEFILIAIAAGYLLFTGKETGVEDLIMVFTLTTLVRVFCYGYFFRSLLDSNRKHYTFNVSLLKYILPFLAIGMVSLISSRADMYSVAYLLGEEELGVYHIFMSYLLIGQAGARLIVVPFEKSIYRATPRLMKSAIRLMLLLGIGITIFWTACVWVIITIGYGMDLPFSYYLLSPLLNFPVYIYYLIMIRLLKRQLQRTVFVINAISVFVNVGLCFLLVPLAGLKGAMIAASISQLTMTIAYMIAWRFASSSK